jgi:HK97 gp10 family phage protein
MTADEIEEYLESLPDKVQGELADILQEQAERLSAAQRAELQAQQTSPDETGDLEASCRVETRNDPLDVHVVAGGDLTTTEVRSGSGEPYDYALGFEFGNSRQSARPFFWNTYRALKPSIDQAIAEATQKALDD